MSSRSDTPDPPNRPLQFSLRGVLIAQPALVLLVGVVPLLEAIGHVVIQPAIGVDWYRSAYDGLINLGVPSSFVLVAVDRLSEWAVLALVNLVLGLLRSKRAHVGAWLLAIAFPFTKFVVYPMSDIWFAIQVVSLCGLPIGLAAWFIGWRLRGRDYDRAVELRFKWLRNGLRIAVWILLAVAGSYGWLILVRMRSIMETFF